LQSVTTSPRRRRRSRYTFLPRWLTPKRLVAVVTAFVLVLAGVWGTRTVLALGHLFHSDPLTTVRTVLGINGESNVDKQSQNLQRINIALYGYGGPGHDGPYLTDSIMIVSIQPQQSGPPRIAEISIPRDWWVPVDLGNGKNAMQRVNTAYSSGELGAPFQTSFDNSDKLGGGRAANATIGRMLGIHIDYFVGVDFDAFKQAVDSVGGIDVNVQHTFTDSNYPSDGCDNGGQCKPITIHFDAGQQHMDGQTALQFSRSRESTDPQEGTNFARNKRQQLVLNAVKAKVLSVGGISKLPDLLNALGDNVLTNLPIDDAKSLYELVKGVDNASIVHVSIDDTNFVYECGNRCNASVEYPHDRTFASVSHYVNGLFVDSAAVAEKTQVTVVDASGRGLAADQRWASLLTPLGLSATAGGTQRGQGPTQVIDASGGSGAKTAQWLASFLGVTVTAPPAGSNAAQAGGVTVVLGQEEEQAFNNPAAGLYTS
jgi:LCP family protein required for cell wall assembly